MSTTNEELVQTTAMRLTVSEASRLLKRIDGAQVLRTYGIEVYTVSSEPMIMQDGSKHDAVVVMVRAETEMQAGIGKGFVLALVDGVSK